jgi:hypothetical protein
MKDELYESLATYRGRAHIVTLVRGRDESGPYKRKGGYAKTVKQELAVLVPTR